MKSILIPLVLAVLMNSCNTVSADYYVLTDDNADAFEPKYRFWQSAELDDKGGSILEFRNFEEGKKQKLWMMDGYPKANKNLPIYVRTKKVSNDKRIIQITSWDDGKREISLVYGKFINDSSLLLYGYNKELFKTVKSSEALSDIKGHITVKDTEVNFDSTAVTRYRNQLLKFLDQELSDSKHFKKDSVIFSGKSKPAF